MTTPDELTRRTVMAALAALPVVSSAASGSNEQGQRVGSPTLVAYFSRSGNTRVVAGLIHRALNADVFEIRPASPYPEDYLQTVDLAREQRDRGVEPPLQANVSNMAAYDTLYLGFPIWGETTPPVIRSFLKANNLAGKTLIPFITHGGYGLGNSESVLATHAPGARLLRGFAMQADQERQTMDRVNNWLKETKAIESAAR